MMSSTHVVRVGWTSTTERSGVGNRGKQGLKDAGKSSIFSRHHTLHISVWLFSVVSWLHFTCLCYMPASYVLDDERSSHISTYNLQALLQAPTGVAVIKLLEWIRWVPIWILLCPFFSGWKVDRHMKFYVALIKDWCGFLRDDLS